MTTPIATIREALAALAKKARSKTPLLSSAIDRLELAEKDLDSAERGWRDLAEYNALTNEAANAYLARAERAEAALQEAQRENEKLHDALTRREDETVRAEANCAAMRVALEGIRNTVEKGAAVDSDQLYEYVDRALASGAGAPLLARLTENDSELQALHAELEKLRAFKAYVHGRLDKMKVPTNPDREANAEHGCRIEGRLNYLEERREAQRDTALERVERLELAIVNMAHAGKHLGLAVADKRLSSEFDRFVAIAKGLLPKWPGTVVDAALASPPPAEPDRITATPQDHATLGKILRTGKKAEGLDHLLDAPPAEPKCLAYEDYDAGTLCGRPLPCATHGTEAGDD